MSEEPFEGKQEAILGEISRDLRKIADAHKPDPKWQFLYQYSRQSLDEEINRFQILDTKATKLLTTASFIFTTFLAFFKWAVIDAPNDLSGSIYLLSALTFGFLSFAICCYFRSMKLTQAPRAPLCEDTLTMFKENNLDSVYIALYKACLNCVDRNHELNEAKANAIKYGYQWTTYTGMSLLVLVASIFYDTAYSHSEKIISTEEHAMTKKETEADEKSNTPNFDVPAPAYKLVTNNEDDDNNPPDGENGS